MVFWYEIQSCGYLLRKSYIMGAGLFKVGLVVTLVTVSPTVLDDILQYLLLKHAASVYINPRLIKLTEKYIHVHMIISKSH